MSVFEPPIQPRPEFGEELWVRLLTELDRPVRRLPVRTLLLAAALLFALAGVASATYLGVRLLSVQHAGRPGQLTAVSDHTIVVLTASGQRVVWHCPRRVFCGDLAGLDWAPDGRRVAFTLGEVGGRSAYIGLHIVDLRSGRDLHLPRMRLAHPLRPSQPRSIIQRELKAMISQLGCLPADIAWSPSGRRLVYGCGSIIWGRTRLSGVMFTISPDGRHRQKIRTGTNAAYSPSWSPDGSHLVFATGASPAEVIAVRPTVTVRSNLYLVGLDGLGRRLLARDASAPDWSPAGQAIAYETAHGVRLITPGGHDITPPRRLPNGIPRWSPDGAQLAIETAQGMFVYDTRTWHKQQLTSEALGGVFATGRPAWYPGPFTPRVRSLQGSHQCVLCF